MARTHAHTTTHTLTSSRTFRFVLRLCSSKICACLCQSGASFLVFEQSSAMKVNAWTCKCATDRGFESGFEFGRFLRMGVGLCVAGCSVHRNPSRFYGRAQKLRD